MTTSERVQRPPRNYETGPTTRWIRRFAVALTAAVAIALLVRYPSLPDTIPTHFNAAGQADAWGSRSSVFILIAIFVVIVAGITWLSHHPSIFNYPGVITEHNAQELYRAGEQMLVWVAAACAAIFTGIAFSLLFEMNAAILVVPAIIGLVIAAPVSIARMVKA